MRRWEVEAVEKKCGGSFCEWRGSCAPARETRQARRKGASDETKNTSHHQMMDRNSPKRQGRRVVSKSTSKLLMSTIILRLDAHGVEYSPAVVQVSGTLIAPTVQINGLRCRWRPARPRYQVPPPPNRPLTLRPPVPLSITAMEYFGIAALGGRGSLCGPPAPDVELDS